ncbi:MAG: lipoyl domain-containing protein, partial [Rikenellaceae bacterium]|nr:lipoyl domain-containing protein [Rikenellaceae bacterium]
MATAVIMPKQGQSVESCILTELRKKKGDKVSPGDVLFAYETDKASFEEEAKEAGEILEVFFDEGDEIPVLTNVLVSG